MSSKKNIVKLGQNLTLQVLTLVAMVNWTIETQQTPSIINFWAFVLNFMGHQQRQKELSAASQSQYFEWYIFCETASLIFHSQDSI